MSKPTLVYSARDNPFWLLLRTKEEVAQDEKEEQERAWHEDGDCFGYPRCFYCVEARELAEETKGG